MKSVVRAHLVSAILVTTITIMSRFHSICAYVGFKYAAFSTDHRNSQLTSFYALKLQAGSCRLYHQLYVIYYSCWNTTNFVSRRLAGTLSTCKKCDSRAVFATTPTAALVVLLSHPNSRRSFSNRYLQLSLVGQTHLDRTHSQKR